VSNNKNILIGVCGGIAAYKIPILVRLFVKQNYNVKLILTKASHNFVTEKTLSVLSKNQVVSDFFDNNNNWNNHVQLAEWADVLIIAPLTANTLAKMATGICDNVLLATYLSCKSKTIVAPAMDLEMYQHPSTINNLKTIQSYKNLIIPAQNGELASGLVGEGRMAEPEDIFNFTLNYFKNQLPLLGKNILVNAGPTYEAIDPVRYIGNRSSGKMGIAIANYFSALGANVNLVLGPCNQNNISNNINIINVESANEMYNACMKLYESVDVAVCSAAVADYTPETINEQKIKKTDKNLNLNLVKTKDILADMGLKKTKQFLVGFALETENVIEYAKQKLKNKNLDLIVANSAKETGAGFGTNTNKITIIDKHNKMYNFELKSKELVAKDIVNTLMNLIK
jgi:phosphopantothenoylcysteine decarboxylase/phosphopantothenate--cysteine ligase